MRRTKAVFLGAALALLASPAFFAAVASATYEATLVPRKGGERSAGPTFVVEAGGGRRTRILDLSFAGGRCGSIYAPLLDAGKVKGGFANGNGAAVFSLKATKLQLRVELRVRPHGEDLTARGLLQATVDSCHEKVPLDLVTAKIRGGGRHAGG
ncbi:MAG TPA: hypothetical protein VHB53_07115 [Solirubrobacterales bacterium]|nr:hypothetical protein [Solirubrobacterales bacterium]